MMWKLYVSIEDDSPSVEELVYEFETEKDAYMGQRIIIEASDFMLGSLVLSNVMEGIK